MSKRKSRNLYAVIIDQFSPDAPQDCVICAENIDQAKDIALKYITTNNSRRHCLVIENAWICYLAKSTIIQKNGILCMANINDWSDIGDTRTLIQKRGEKIY